MKSAIALWLLVAAGVAHAAPLIDEPVAELRLKNNKVYKQAKVVSYNATSAAFRHLEGGASAKYEDFPDEFRQTLEAKRPANAKYRSDYVAPSAPAKPLLRLPDRPSLDFPPPPPLSTHTGEIATISGQVFITTKGSGNIKLGGVRVSVYSEQDFSLQSEWIYNTATKAQSVFIERSRLLSSAERFDEASAELRTSSEVTQAAWGSMSRSPYSTTTDADGRFTLKHMISGPYYVVAGAQRAVTDETEYYKWAVPSKDIEEPGNLLLHNENMK